MKEGAVYHNVVLPAHDQAAEISQPGEGALDFPPALVAPQLAAILQGGLHAIASMRANQLNAPLCQPLPQGIRVAGLIIDDALRVLPRPPRSAARDRHGVQGFLQQGHFGRGRRFQEVSQRNTLAVDHHHPLRALAAFGLPDTGAPFFAGAKLASAKASAQSSWPWASSWAKKARHACSHTPCASQSCRRRQQVLGEGNRSGRSFHRAPVRKTQRMPSNTGRFGMGLGPPRGEALSSGNNGASFSHWASVSSDRGLAIHGPPFAGYYSGRNPGMQTPRGRGYETASRVSESKFVMKIDDVRFAFLDHGDLFRKILMIP